MAARTCSITMLNTVPRLYPRVRPGADYRRSLAGAGICISPGSAGKVRFDAGRGENSKEITAALLDLKRCGCRYLTLGQYLAPSEEHLPVVRFVLRKSLQAGRIPPAEWASAGVAAGPLVRSSYRAEEMFETRH